MAAKSSDSFSSGSVISDTEIESIRSEELVVFHSIQAAYNNNDNKKDIVAVYSAGNSVETSSKDWVGLFKKGWQTTDDFSAFQWVSLHPLHPSEPRKRKTVFPHADIGCLSGRFQFLYVAKRGGVMGISEGFHLSDLETALDANLEAAPDANLETAPDANLETAPDAKLEILPDANLETAPDVNLETAPDANLETAPDAKLEILPDAKLEILPDAKLEILPDANLENLPDAFLDQEDIPTSLSLISLGSQLSSSDESASWEITSERSNDAEEEVLIIPPSSSSDPPQVSPSLVPCVDYWNLSDFVIGNRREGFSERLCFVRPPEWASLLEEEGEPTKTLHLSLEGKCFIEELRSSSSKRGQVIPSSFSQASTSLDLVPLNKAAPSFPSLLSSPGPLILTLPRELFLSQQLPQQVFQPKPLRSVVRDFIRKFTAVDAKEASSSQRASPSCLSTSLSPSQGKNRDKELIHISSEKNKDRVFDKKKLEQAKDSTQSDACKDPDAESTGGCGGKKAAVETDKKRGRQKRWVQQSKSKASRTNKDAMLQEALTMMTQASSPSTSSPASTSREDPEETESLCPAVVVAAAARNGAISDRKRRHHHSAVAARRAKRRRLTRRAPTPRPSNTAVADDEGYISLTEEDNSTTVPSYCPAETLELLNFALNEALQENASLRQRLNQAQSQISGARDKATTSGKSTAPEEEEKKQREPEASRKSDSRTSEDGANTRQAAKKKDIPVQCGASTKKKSTNTEKKVERHVASNTTSVPKIDTPSQCEATLTKAKSVNTPTRCVPTAAKSVNTLPTSASKAAQSSISSNNAGACQQPSLPQSPRDGVPKPESDIVTLDLTGLHCASLPSTAVLEPADASLGEWKRVSSKRTLRLQKLIMKKRQEFSRLRENVENYERRTQILEASLQSARTSLSVETTKRIDAEKELKELRIRFWELLGARKSVAWRNAYKSEGNVMYYENLRGPKLNTFSETALTESVKSVSAGSTPKGSVSSSPPLISAEDKNSLNECKVDGKLSEVKEKDKQPVRQDSEAANRKDDKVPIWKENAKLSKRKEDSGSSEGKKKQGSPERRESKKEQKMETTSPPKAKSPGAKTKPKKMDHQEKRKATNTERDQDDKLCVSNPPTINVKAKATEDVQVTATASATVNGIPVPATATVKYNVVPMRVTEVKRTSCSAISLKKLLMPAMAALAETFSPSKCKPKTPAHEGLDSNSTTNTNSTTPADDAPQSKPSSNSDSKVAVSFFVDSSPPAKSKKSSLSLQKSGNNNTSTSTSKKRGKRSRSRGARGGKDKSKLEERSITPCQETFPASSSDITLRRRLSSTFSTSDPRQPEHATEVLPSPIFIPIQAAREDATADVVGSNASRDHQNPPGVEKWRPLHIPAKTWRADANDADDANDDDDDDDDHGLSSGVIAPLVLPFKACLAPLRRPSPEKARPQTYADAATGNFNRNQLARAVLSSCSEPQTIRDVTRTVTSPGLPDVIPSPRDAFPWNGDKSASGVKPARPVLPSPLSCFYRPPPSSSTLTTAATAIRTPVPEAAYPVITTTTTTNPISTPSSAATTITSSSSSPSSTSPVPVASPPASFKSGLPVPASVITTQPQKMMDSASLRFPSTATQTATAAATTAVTATATAATAGTIRIEQVHQPRYHHHHHHQQQQQQQHVPLYLPPANHHHCHHQHHHQHHHLPQQQQLGPGNLRFSSSPPLLVPPRVAALQMDTLGAPVSATLAKMPQRLGVAVSAAAAATQSSAFCLRHPNNNNHSAAQKCQACSFKFSPAPVPNVGRNIVMKDHLRFHNAFTE